MKGIKSKFTRTSTWRLAQTILVSVLAAILTVHLQGQQVAIIAIGIGVVHVVLALGLLLAGHPIMHGKKE